MDVHCTTCDEPWDVYHLQQNIIFETGLSGEEARRWRLLPHSKKFTDHYREEFKAVGWEFGQSVINVVRCPVCPKDARPNPDRIQTKAALEELMGDDEDGLASAYENYRL